MPERRRWVVEEVSTRWATPTAVDHFVNDASSEIRVKLFFRTGLTGWHAIDNFLHLACSTTLRARGQSGWRDVYLTYAVRQSAKEQIEDAIEEVVHASILDKLVFTHMMREQRPDLGNVAGLNDRVPNLLFRWKWVIVVTRHEHAGSSQSYLQLTPCWSCRSIHEERFPFDLFRRSIHTVGHHGISGFRAKPQIELPKPSSGAVFDDPASDHCAAAMDDSMPATSGIRFMEMIVRSPCDRSKSGDESQLSRCLVPLA